MPFFKEYLSLARGISLDSLNRYYDEKPLIGGPGHVVQIDESKIGKRKNNKERLSKGSWIWV